MPQQMLEEHRLGPRLRVPEKGEGTGGVFMGCVPAFWAGPESHWLSATRDFGLPLKTPPPAQDPPTHPPILTQATFWQGSPAGVLPLPLPFSQVYPFGCLGYTLIHWCNPLGTVPQTAEGLRLPCGQLGSIIWTAFSLRMLCPQRRPLILGRSKICLAE